MANWKINKENLHLPKFTLFTYYAYIEEVTDGDTVIATIDRGFGDKSTHKYRIYQEGDFYFDTPEIKKYKGVTEEHKRHGLEAKKRAEELLLNKFVFLRTHKKGSFRYLAEIFLLDGRSYVDIMVKEGFQKKDEY